MALINVLDFGTDNSGVTDASASVTAAFKACKKGDTVFFPKGRYLFMHKVTASDLDGVAVKGEDAVIVTHFCRNSFDGLEGALRFFNCRDITVGDLYFDMDVSPNSAGYIKGFDLTGGTVDIKIYDEFDFDGSETISSVMSMDDDLSPDYRIATYTKCEYTVPEKNVIRIPASYFGGKLPDVPVGTKIAIRHVIYGASLIEFVSVRRCTVENVTVYTAPGLVFVIRPRCLDFMFKNCAVKLPENTKRLLAANADGIHVLGLEGSLTLEDCYFEQLGDDALNIHGIAGTVKDAADKELYVYYGRLSNQNIVKPLGPDWAAAGDVIHVYDRTNFLKKGELRVISYDNGKMKYELLSGSVADGDIAGNCSFYAKTTVRGCTVRNTRARAFLLQTRDVLIENNDIYGISAGAVLVSPDIKVWHEVGPSENVVIRNNRIEKCCFAHRPSGLAAVIFKCAHDTLGDEYPAGVHKNAEISGNTFKDIPVSGIYASAVDGLTVKNNVYDNCCYDPIYDSEYLRHKTAVVKCRITENDCPDTFMQGSY